MVDIPDCGGASIRTQRLATASVDSFDIGMAAVLKLARF
jgi:hypothetical protein